MEDVMIRISVLWIFFAVANSAHYVMLFFEPDIAQKAGAGASKRLATVEAFTNWLIPLTMAFLSVTLGDLVIRYLNMALGGLFTLLGIIHIAVCPIVHISNKPSVHQLLISISTVVVTALIFWYAWSWQF
ncbi:MAG: hypothetical protein PVH12_03715 [Candidatus Bathyarchaeota archaeon]|jgi:hypothetical protein